MNIEVEYIDLGDYVEDKISGFKGVAIAKKIFISGDVDFSVQPKEGIVGGPMFHKVFNMDQLRVIKKRVVPYGMKASLIKESGLLDNL